MARRAKGTRPSLGPCVARGIKARSTALSLGHRIRLDDRVCMLIERWLDRRNRRGSERPYRTPLPERPYPRLLAKDANSVTSRPKRAIGGVGARCIGTLVEAGACLTNALTRTPLPERPYPRLLAEDTNSVTSRPKRAIGGVGARCIGTLVEAGACLTNALTRTPLPKVVGERREFCDF